MRQKTKNMHLIRSDVDTEPFFSHDGDNLLDAGLELNCLDFDEKSSGALMPKDRGKCPGGALRALWHGGKEALSVQQRRANLLERIRVRQKVSSGPLETQLDDKS